MPKHIHNITPLIILILTMAYPAIPYIKFYRIGMDIYGWVLPADCAGLTDLRLKPIAIITFLRKICPGSIHIITRYGALPGQVNLVIYNMIVYTHKHLRK